MLWVCRNIIQMEKYTSLGKKVTYFYRIITIACYNKLQANLQVVSNKVVIIWMCGAIVASNIHIIVMMKDMIKWDMGYVECMWG